MLKKCLSAVSSRARSYNPGVISGLPVGIACPQLQSGNRFRKRLLPHEICNHVLPRAFPGKQDSLPTLHPRAHNSELKRGLHSIQQQIEDVCLDLLQPDHLSAVRSQALPLQAGQQSCQRVQQPAGPDALPRPPLHASILGAAEVVLDAGSQQGTAAEAVVRGEGLAGCFEVYNQCADVTAPVPCFGAECALNLQTALREGPPPPDQYKVMDPVDEWLSRAGICVFIISVRFVRGGILE